MDIIRHIKSFFWDSSSDKSIFVYKSLPDYTDEELMALLKNNENETNSVMVGICSEVLRRMLLENKFK